MRVRLREELVGFGRRSVWLRPAAIFFNHSSSWPWGRFGRLGIDMGLMTGTGPLGKDPAGTFNFEPPPPGRALYMEPCLKRVRIEVGGETIADSRRTLLLSESGH